MLKRILFILWIILVVVSIGVVAGYLGGVFQKDRIITPHIVPMQSELPPITATHQFPFENEWVTITVPVNRSVYDGAKHADKSVTIFGNVSENIWIADSYRAMTYDPVQDDLYGSLTTEFGKIKTQRGLSDDEYLELIVAYVQSLRYETLTENPAKFPVETVVDASGDCDDKSLLLAGLLTHEGYRVALLSFGPESHMAVGVGSDAYGYKNTKYAFIESTNFSYVGVPTTTLDNGIVLRSDPIVVPMGDGSKIYHLGDETKYINNMSSFSKTQANDLEPQIGMMESDLTERWHRISSLEEEMARFRDSGEIRNYNTLAEEHNLLVSAYNRDLNTFRQLQARYNHYAEMYNFIISHEYDRKGVYEYLQRDLPG